MSRTSSERVRVRVAASTDLGALAPPTGLPPAPEPPRIVAPASAGATASAHYGRLRDGVRRLRTTARSFRVTDRTLLVLGGILAPVGLLVIVIGWWGAAHSPFLFQQVPYLISGGVFGLALVVIGAFLYFAYWLTQLVKEQRRQTSAIVEAIARLDGRFAVPTVESTAVNGHNGHQTTSAPAAAAPGSAAAPTSRAAASAAASAPVAPAAPPDAPAASAEVAAPRPSATSSPGPMPAQAGQPMLVATVRGSMAHRPDCVVVAGKVSLREVTVADGLGACRLCDPYGP